MQNQSRTTTHVSNERRLEIIDGVKTYPHPFDFRSTTYGHKGGQFVYLTSLLKLACRLNSLDKFVHLSAYCLKIQYAIVSC